MRHLALQYITKNWVECVLFIISFHTGQNIDGTSMRAWNLYGPLRPRSMARDSQRLWLRDGQKLGDIDFELRFFKDHRQLQFLDV